MDNYFEAIIKVTDKQQLDYAYEIVAVRRSSYIKRVWTAAMNWITAGRREKPINFLNTRHCVVGIKVPSAIWKQLSGQEKPVILSPYKETVVECDTAI